MHTFKSALRPLCILLLLTAAAVLIHGYHMGIEDQDVYLAAINKNLNPALYPFNSVFFTEQMKSSLFIQAVAGSIRLTGVPVAWALLLWQIFAIFLVLLGCWRVASACFVREAAQWAGVLMVTVLLTMPIAGTSLFLVDPYLHPRAPATGFILLALAQCLKKNWLMTAMWLLLAGLMHPLMALFGVSLIVFAGVEIAGAGPRGNAKASAGQDESRKNGAGIGAAKTTGRAGVLVLMPLGLLGHPSAAWKEATQARRYYFPLMWTWYEWLGLIAPVVLVWWFARIAQRHGMATLERLAGRLVAFAVFQFAVGVVMTFPAATEQLAAYQPMRWLHIFYFLFLLMAGGLTEEFLLRGKAWRRSISWLIVFVPLAAGMCYVQRDEFRYSNHIEWPGRAVRNPWARAFLWVGEFTPQDAVFAIDPRYMTLHAEEGYGFRALAKRSLLAENHKDPGAATVFPALAETWQEQVHAQRGIEGFTPQQFHQLNVRYGVTWTVLPVTASVEIPCPYRNEIAQVCRVE
jgi:hypothetical protein